jgi:ribosomal protein S18 acetylase RimI-like enzyme
MPRDEGFLSQVRLSPLISTNLESFECQPAIDWFLKKRAREFEERRLCTVLCWTAGDDLAGFATTSMSVLEVQSSTEREKMGLSGIVVREGGRHYQVFPALLIGVLGVCSRYRRLGLGEHMVKYCVGLALEAGVGCRFVVVDSEPSEEATGLYEKCGFTRLGGQDAKRTTVRMYYDLAG